MGFDDVFWFAAGASVTIGLMVLVFRKPLKELGSFIKWTKQFREDWSGEPAREGRDATPGVMQRLARLDGELTRNGGETTKDKAAKAFEIAEKIDSKVDKIATALTAETAAREAWDEQYRKDQERIRLEWVEVFMRVSQMISLPPEEQQEMWDALTARYVTNTLVPPVER